MDQKIVVAPKISCGHCTKTIERELGEIDGLIRVTADPGSKQVEIVWDAPATWSEIADVLDDIGFPPAD